MKPALVVIDMQKDFFQKKHLLEQRELLVENLNRLIELARKHKLPVIWVRQVWKYDLSNSPKHIRQSGKGYVLEGTKGSELLDELSKLSEDYEVIKTRNSGFFGTNLDSLLNELGVDTLIVGGINTHACVRMTAIDAWQKDYDVIVAKDCVASYDDKHHKVTMKYFEPVIAEIKTNEEIKKLL